MKFMISVLVACSFLVVSGAAQPCSSQTSQGSCAAVCPDPGQPGQPPPPFAYWLSCSNCTRVNGAIQWPGIITLRYSCYEVTNGTCEGTCQTAENPPRRCIPMNAAIIVRCDDGSERTLFLRQCCAPPLT